MDILSCEIDTNCPAFTANLDVESTTRLSGDEDFHGRSPQSLRNARKGARKGT